MQHRELGTLGGRGDDEVRDAGAAVLSSLGEQALDLDGAVKRPLVDRNACVSQLDLVAPFAMLVAGAHAE